MRTVEWKMYCGKKVIANGCGEPFTPIIQNNILPQRCEHCGNYIMFRQLNIAPSTTRIEFQHE